MRIAPFREKIIRLLKTDDIASFRGRRGGCVANCLTYRGNPEGNQALGI